MCLQRTTARLAQFGGFRQFGFSPSSSHGLDQQHTRIHAAAQDAEDIDAQLTALEAELRGSMTPGPTLPEREVQERAADRLLVACASCSGSLLVLEGSAGVRVASR
jgi:hypothetical protein